MNRIKGFITLVRSKQWVKNIFVILPFLFVANEVKVSDFLIGIQMLAIFVLASASVYCFNDFYDAEKDKSENRRNRPLVMGTVQPIEAQILSALLFFCSLALCLLVATEPAYCLFIIALYVSINFVYSKYELKRQSSIGLMIVALGFPLRFLFGTVFLNLDVSYWALIMLLYLSLFLLAGKRFSRSNLISKESFTENHQNVGGNFRSENEFWRNTFLILGAASISSYLAFLADSKTQSHWGDSISMFSVIPYSIFVLTYFEYVVKQKHEGDSTENIINNLGFLALGAIWTLIMLVARLNQIH